jgi:hypothetical protein
MTLRPPITPNAKMALISASWKLWNKPWQESGRLHSDGELWTVMFAGA